MTRARFVVLTLAGTLVALLPAGPAAAGIPTDQLRGAIDRVVKALESPAYKGETRAVERRAAIRRIANDIFDFGEIARRSLGRHWASRSEAERQEFVALFGDLLERSYISKIENYGGERIQYVNERVDGEAAVVATRIITKNGTEVPVDYRLVRRGERWLVYDVSIEGVSLVNNYRTQFNKIIQTQSYGELVRKMKAKQDEASPTFDEDTKKKARTQ